MGYFIQSTKYSLQKISESHSLGLKEISGLLVPQGKASTLLASHLITGEPLRYELAQDKWFESNHLNI